MAIRLKARTDLSSKELSKLVEEDLRIASLRKSLDKNFILPGVISWQAQPGSQEAFLAAKYIFEVIYEGTRGPGKTDTLLMDFYSDVGKGYGHSWKGILFRQTFPQLQDVISKCLKWFSLVCPGARYNASSHTWYFPDGEQLLLRQFMREDDYWNFHGHEYPWVGWEELCNWHTLDGYKRMMSTCRSTHPEVAKIIRYRSTTNPYGPGHNEVKYHFQLPSSRGIVNWKPEGDNGEILPPRLAIHGNIYENKILLQADPGYIDRIKASAKNEAEAKAWLEGSWDVVAGGMFDDVWDPKIHVLPGFAIPSSWRIDRSFDWGSTKPFSLGWWAQSDGSDVQLGDGRWMSTVRGDLFRIGEYYGWDGKPNKGLNMLAADIAKNAVQKEMELGIYGRVKPGPADSAIYTTEDGNCIADNMAKPIRLDDGRRVKGIRFLPADKRKNSRVGGWQKMRQMMKNSIPNGKPRELPGLFIFSDCYHFIRTIPVLSRDKNNLDDIDTNVEDHVADEARYRIMALVQKSRTGSVSGLT